MEAMVYEKGCIRCGLCAAVCPEVFSILPGEAAHAETGDIPDAVQIEAQAAAEGCPVDAITIH